MAPWVGHGWKETIGDKRHSELKDDTILLPTRGKVCYTTKYASIQKAEIDNGWEARQGRMGLVEYGRTG